MATAREVAPAVWRDRSGHRFCGGAGRRRGRLRLPAPARATHGTAAERVELHPCQNPRFCASQKQRRGASRRPRVRQGGLWRSRGDFRGRRMPRKGGQVVECTLWCLDLRLWLLGVCGPAWERLTRRNVSSGSPPVVSAWLRAGHRFGFIVGATFGGWHGRRPGLPTRPRPKLPWCYDRGPELLRSRSWFVPLVLSKCSKPVHNRSKTLSKRCRKLLGKANIFPPLSTPLG